MRNARAFPLLPAALASVPFGFVLVRVRVRHESDYSNESNSTLLTLCPLIHIKVALICWFLEGNIFLNAKHVIIVVAGRTDASSMNSSETLL